MQSVLSSLRRQRRTHTHKTYLNVDAALRIECAVHRMQRDIHMGHRVQQTHEQIGWLHGELLPMAGVAWVVDGDAGQ